MSSLELISTVSFLVTLHCANGLIAAVVAQRKGYAFSAWLGWGLLGGTIALAIALAKPKQSTP